MITLPHVIVSPRDDRSYSRRGVKWVTVQSAEAVGDPHIIERDLAATPLPYLDAGFIEVSLTPDINHTATHRVVPTLSETLIGELETADAMLIPTPVHNYAVPSALKAWIDLVVWPERTFRRTPAGKVSMLIGRSMLVVSASDGNFDNARAQIDLLMPYLRYVFATVDICQVEGVRLQNTARGADSSMQAFESFRQGLTTRMLFMPLMT